MKNNSNYEKDLPGALSDEVIRVFGFPLIRLAWLPGHQKFLISLGSPILQNIQLELRSKRQRPEEIGIIPQVKYFSVEFTVKAGYTEQMSRAVTALRKNHLGVMRRYSNAEQDESQSNGKRSYSLSGEMLLSDISPLLSILEGIAMSGFVCTNKVLPGEIKFLSGNILAGNSAIPDSAPREPRPIGRYPSDIAKTHQYLLRPETIENGFTGSRQPYHEKMLEVLSSIRKKTGVFLSIRDTSYADTEKLSEFFEGYENILEFVLPNEVCGYMVSSAESSWYEVHTGNADTHHIRLRIGAHDSEKHEREVIFILSVQENIGKVVLDTIRRVPLEIGEIQTDMRINESFSPGDSNPATVTLETRISLDSPGNIRKVLGALGKMLHEYGYQLQKTPEILQSFANENGSLQVLAQMVTAPAQIKPPVDR